MLLLERMRWCAAGLLHREEGQTTAEYALVILAAAAVAVVLIAWAHSSGKLPDVLRPGDRQRHGERRVRRRGREEQGASAVEFALVLPLLLVVALALVQVGLLVRDRLLVEAAARAGARTAAVEADQAAIVDAVARSAPDLDAGALTVAVSRAGAQGDPVSVTVGYTSAIRVPFIGWLITHGVGMESTATDRQEFG